MGINSTKLWSYQVYAERSSDLPQAKSFRLGNGSNSLRRGGPPSRQSSSHGRDVRTDAWVALDTILLHPGWRGSFISFLEKEIATENLHFFEAVERLVILQDEAFFTEWHGIMRRFIHVDAPEVINISECLRIELNELEHIGIPPSRTVTIDKLQAAQKEVFAIMVGSLVRFEKSQVFNAFLCRRLSIPEPALPEPIPIAGTTLLMLLDSSPLISKLITDIIKRDSEQAHHVSIFSSASEALLNLTLEYYDVIVVDLDTDGMIRIKTMETHLESEVYLARQQDFIKSARRTQTIVGMSLGDGSSEMAREAMARGFHCILEKPFSWRKYLAAIKERPENGLASTGTDTIAPEGVDLKNRGSTKQ